MLSLCHFVFLLIISKLSLSQTFATFDKNNDDCSKTLLTLIENPDYKMISNSGKGLNDLGLYEECSQDPESKYVLITVIMPSLFKIKPKLGFCGPINCTLKNYEAISSHLELYLIRSMNLTENSGVSFSFYFPSDLNNQEYNTGTLVMIVILSFILGICLVGTFVDINENYYPFMQFFFRSLEKKESLLLTQVEDNEFLVTKKLKKSNRVIFFCCFSYLTNLNKLMKNLSGESDPRLEIFNGIRVIGMMWIIFGHTYYYLLVTPVLNPMKLLDLVDKFWYQILLQAPLAVDSFFFLAGFLSSYLIISEIKKSNGKFNLFFWFFHRYYRIMPLYSFLIFIAWKFEPYINQGPVWPEFKMSFDEGCSNYWWSNIIFLNNFISWDNPCTCFGWGWYLANDFQFFTITPFLIFINYHSKILGWIAIATLLSGSYVITLYLAINNDYPVDMLTLAPNYLDYWNTIYCKPYCRIATYLIGVILAYLYIEQNDKSSKPNDFAMKVKKAVNNKYFRYFLYFLSFWLITLPVFLPYNANKNPGKWSMSINAIYITFSRTVFVLGISLFVYPCLLGHGSLIFKFLAAGFWTPFARLTFAAYLVHPMIIQMSYYSTKQGVYIDITRIFFNYCAHLFLAFSMALLLSISIESPLLNIEKSFIFKRKGLDLKNKNLEKEAKKKENEEGKSAEEK